MNEMEIAVMRQELINAREANKRFQIAVNGWDRREYSMACLIEELLGGFPKSKQKPLTPYQKNLAISDAENVILRKRNADLQSLLDGIRGRASS